MPNRKKTGFRRRRPFIIAPTPPNRNQKRKQWTSDQMLAAIDDVRKGLSCNRAADANGIPRSTLKDRVSGRVEHGSNPGPVPYLTAEEEALLADYLLKCSDLGYGKTRRDVCCIVEAYLKQKKSLRGERVSNGWWEKFLRRNPTLRLRLGDSTAGVRMDAVNSENMDHYFKLLKDTFDQYDFANHPESIFNMDETGMPLCPRPPKVVARKGQKKVRYRSSGKKSQVTVLACGSATGQVIPPFIVFAGKQISPLWTENEVNGSRFAVSDNGWVDQELFNFWLINHFLPNAPSGRPLLLLLDGHSSHFEPYSIQFAREHNVIIFCLPPHTTHECQPLDTSFFRSLKSHWQNSVHKFYQDNPGKVINKVNFCSVFKPAWLNACTPANFVNGFKKTGIYPLNRQAINTGDEVSKQKTTGTRGSTEQASPETQQEEAHNSCEDDAVNLVGRADLPDTVEFTVEEHLIFRRRYEEGYDLTDPRYDAWLLQEMGVAPVSAHTVLLQSSEPEPEMSCLMPLSPEPADVSPPPPTIPVTPQLALMSTPPSTLPLSTEPADVSLSPSTIPVIPQSAMGCTPSSTRPEPAVISLSPSTIPVTQLASGSTPHSTFPLSRELAVVSPPPSSVPITCEPTEVSKSPFSSPRLADTSPHSSAGTLIRTPSSKSSKTTVSPVRSPLSEFLNLPDTPLSRPLPYKKPKTGHARVLTSFEAWSILREKEEKKRQEAEEKEKRKLEREEKKKKREGEKKRKDEEKALRVEQREAKRRKKEDEKAQREQAKAQKAQEKLQKEREKALRATAEREKRGADEEKEQDSTSTPAATKRPAESSSETGRPLRKRVRQIVANDAIVDNMCCVCLGTYEEDEGTGRVWLQCPCSRWIHQDCVIPSNSSTTRLCPIC